jgi:glycosyltransferase 2 family protein
VKKHLITLLKVTASLAILAYLVSKSLHGVDDPTTGKHINVFETLRDQPLHWDMLAGAFACCFAGTMLTFIRWWYLVVALDVPLRFRDAIRISTWGYLWNLAPLGIVGGDVVKAWMLAHEHPQARAKALASVLFDRIVGLYLLFVAASAAIMLSGFWEIDVPKIHATCVATFIATAVGTVGLAIVLGPDLSKGRSTRAIGRIPRIGPPIESLINAVRMYSSQPVVVIVSSIMSIGVHCVFATACYLIARGLPGDVFPFGIYFVIMPLSAAAGVLPLNFGPLEFAMDFLYLNASVGIKILPGQGLLVAFMYRIITYSMAILGIPYYFSNRREMAEVIHEVEEEEHPST